MRQTLLASIIMILGAQLNSQTVIISELADPNDNDLCRFVELHCEGPAECDLTGYELRRWTNGNTSTTSSIDLSVLPNILVNGNVVIANNAAFTSCYGFSADLVAGSGGPADSNGDDQIGLFKDNVLVDIFGVPGEDGSGTCHEFEDGRAVRKSTVTDVNDTWDEAEWDVFADSGPTGGTTCPNLVVAAQNVIDMNPGQSALPVELTSFEVRTIDTDNVLVWKTASELNNDHFSIERSQDGQNYTSIGKVEGNGTTNRMLTYSFSDEAPKSGVNFYRLKQVDYDGKFAYSGIVQAFNTAKQTRVFPTVTDASVQVEVSQDATVQVVDITGKPVINSTIEKGINQLDLSQLTAGQYMIQVIQGNQVSTTPIIKQ